MERQINFTGTTLVLIFIGSVIFSLFKIHTLPAEAFFTIHNSNVVAYFYFAISAGFVAITYLYIKSLSAVKKEIVYIDKINEVKQILIPEIINEVTHMYEFNSVEKEIEACMLHEPSGRKKSEKILALLCNHLKAGQGILYQVSEEQPDVLSVEATYAYPKQKIKELQFEIGRGLPGLVAKEKRMMVLDNIPEGYLNVSSGLGTSSPSYLLLLPLYYQQQVTGVLEIGLFWKPESVHDDFFHKVSLLLGKTKSSMVN